MFCPHPPTSVLVLEGDRGLGKSALLANWAERRRLQEAAATRRENARTDEERAAQLAASDEIDAAAERAAAERPSILQRYEPYIRSVASLQAAMSAANTL